jgi:hypothetical protein
MMVIGSPAPALNDEVTFCRNWEGSPLAFVHGGGAGGEQ